MLKLITLIILFTSFSFSSIQSELENDPKKFTKLLKNKTRIERQKICFKIMKENEIKNPIVAFSAGNCLLYNGYGKQAIPLFTNYIYNGQNEKYFNGRIGYGWLHSGDWYKVGKEVIMKMTKNQSIFEWTNKEIRKELKNNPKKYKVDVLSLEMKENIN